MKLSAMPILFGLILAGAGLPASAIAQAQTPASDPTAAPAPASPAVRPKANAPVIRTKWSLTDPSKKKAAKEAAAAKLGPAVPAPQRLRLPRAKAAAKPSVQRKRKGVNATPVISQAVRSIKKD